MTPGRAYLAVGTGGALNGYAAVARWPGYAQRREMLAEAIGLIRQLWTGDPSRIMASTTRLVKPVCMRAPRSRFRCASRRSCLAARSSPDGWGDGLITIGGKPPEMYAQMLNRLKHGARVAGEDPSTLWRSIELNVGYTENADRAISDPPEYWAGTFISSAL
jgi:alkanesulfonate monooxygenase SsuD/methylene tetrahydromethanopterin reductase-like flavin-dependent oxidoreductase (luciferase family)